MIVTLYRIIPTEYTDSAFTGEGAKKVNGRWHSQGIPMIYTAMSEASAILEILVHLQSSVGLQNEYSIIEASLDDSFIKVLQFPKGVSIKSSSRKLRLIGNDWHVSRSSLGLKVPSVVAPSDYNVLLNPRHVDFEKIEISAPRPAYFDARLKT